MCKTIYLSQKWWRSSHKAQRDHSTQAYLQYLFPHFIQFDLSLASQTISSCSRLMLFFSSNPPRFYLFKDMILSYWLIFSVLPKYPTNCLIRCILALMQYSWCLPSQCCFSRYCSIILCFLDAFTFLFYFMNQLMSEMNWSAALLTVQYYYTSHLPSTMIFMKSWLNYQNNCFCGVFLFMTLGSLHCLYFIPPTIQEVIIFSLPYCLNLITHHYFGLTICCYSYFRLKHHPPCSFFS